jgi:hypothetical protein
MGLRLIWGVYLWFRQKRSTLGFMQATRIHGFVARPHYRA